MDTKTNSVGLKKKRADSVTSGGVCDYCMFSMKLNSLAWSMGGLLGQPQNSCRKNENNGINRKNKRM